MMVQSDIIIVRGSQADHAWCAQLMASTEPWITLRRDRSLCEVALHRPASELFIARLEDQKMGFILLTPNGVAGSPYIASVAVDVGARGQGLGTKLLMFAEQRYPEARNIFLCVSDFNERARMLYERCGYRQVGVLENYAIEGHSELLMRKRLK